MKKHFYLFILSLFIFACNSGNNPDDLTPPYGPGVQAAIEALPDKEAATKLEVYGKLGVVDWYIIPRLHEELPVLEELVLHDETELNSFGFVVEEGEKNTWLKTLTAVDMERIGSHDFGGCEALESVSFGDNLKSIGDNAFSGFKTLEKAYFGKNVKSIGSSAFAKCEMLTEATFGENVETIGESAFSECSMLRSAMKFPKLTELKEYTFFACTNLVRVVIPNVKKIGESALAYTKIETMDCPLLEEIGKEAFAYTNLLEVNFPNVIDIPWRAFAGASQLKTIRLPNALWLGGSAFNLTFDLQVLELTVNEYIASNSTTFFECPTENVTLYLSSVGYTEVLDNNVWHDMKWKEIKVK